MYFGCLNLKYRSRSFVTNMIQLLYNGGRLRNKFGDLMFFPCEAIDICGAHYHTVQVSMPKLTKTPRHAYSKCTSIIIN